MGVEIITNSKYKENYREEKKFELVINCTGNKYNSNFMRENYPSVISKEYRIFVNNYFQITD